MSSIADAFQNLSFGNEAPLTVRQASLTHLVNVKTEPDLLRSVRTDLARLLEYYTHKSRPKSALTTNKSSGQSSKTSVEEKTFTSDRDVLETAPVHLKPQGPIFGQLEALGSFRQAISCLLVYRYNCLVIASLERQKLEMSPTRRHTKGFETLWPTLDRAYPTTILNYTTQFVEK